MLENIEFICKCCNNHFFVKKANNITLFKKTNMFYVDGKKLNCIHCNSTELNKVV